MSDPEPPRRRRPRYAGTHPRRFADRYKERDPARYGDTVAKVLASGKTPAGSHRPILVDEVLAVLDPRPGDRVADCTLGHGGHARRLLERIAPGGLLIGLDADPIELPRTEARLRAEGFGPEIFRAVRTNYAALPKALSELGIDGVDCLLADLGLSSMQIDDPARGFSVKADGPLDMRMNPGRPLTAAALLERTPAHRLARLLSINADEPALAPMPFGNCGRVARGYARFSKGKEWFPRSALFEGGVEPSHFHKRADAPCFSPSASATRLDRPTSGGVQKSGTGEPQSRTLTEQQGAS
jgi:16S rRNA (cytosine1402-N4)-methyltransferase